MNTPKPSVLTRRDLAKRLGVSSIRSVARFERRYGLEPVNYIGLEPVFDPSQVAKAEQRRLADRRRTLARIASGKLVASEAPAAPTAAVSVITLAEAKRRAGITSKRKGAA